MINDLRIKKIINRIKYLINTKLFDCTKNLIKSIQTKNVIDTDNNLFTILTNLSNDCILANHCRQIISDTYNLYIILYPWDFKSIKVLSIEG